MKAIVYGLPRSGTQITTRILQSHIGKPFPFKVTRHAEPEVMVDIHNRWLERQGYKLTKGWTQRFYFPNAKPDDQLVTELTEFITSHDDCVFKDPLLTITLRYLQIDVPTIEVYRNSRKVVGSWVYHKQMDENFARKCFNFYLKNSYDKPDLTIFYTGGLDSFTPWIERCCELLELPFNPDHIKAHWKQEEIEYYAQA